MEKFAVDLDKVLDEFELDEDRASELIANRHPPLHRLSYPKPSENLRQHRSVKPTEPDPEIDLMADANFAVKLPAQPLPQPVGIWSQVPVTPVKEVNLTNGERGEEEPEKIVEERSEAKDTDRGFSQDLEGLIIPVLVTVDTVKEEENVVDVEERIPEVKSEDVAVSESPVNVVGFSEDVEMTEDDLDRYLTEANQSSEEYFTPTTEDNATSFATPSGTEVDSAAACPVEGDLVVLEERIEAENEVVEEAEEEGERRPQRPTSLPLPNKIEVDSGEAEEDEDDQRDSPSVSDDVDQSEMMLTEDERQLGRVAPVWIPDVDAPKCMGCDAKFTVIRRRHHCRACGRVLCAQCCGLWSKLAYMDNKKARVCQPCVSMIERVTAIETGTSTPVNCVQGPRSPNPNNPSEYCSTVPPLQQAQAYLNVPPPSVLVPVGVLKREGSRPRGEPKQVIFSDGIRPGGDLTELDGEDSEPRISVRRHGRVQRRVDSGNGSLSPVRPPRTLASPPAPRQSTPGSESPVSVSPYTDHHEYAFDGHYDTERLVGLMKDESEKPVVFLVNRNLRVLAKIVTLDCCTNCACWCFASRGLSAVGQDEIVVLLETKEDEGPVLGDIFRYFSEVYEDAAKGVTVSNLGHTIFTYPFLGSRDHGGFLYIRPSFQCLQKVLVPEAPYLFAILLQKWEIPWAKVFPIRLMLRLGAEFRYYPCPLTSVRNRRPVYCEIGHTIMNLLADFRNYQYMLPCIPGMAIHMEDNRTTLSFPRNRYDETMKALNSGGIDHVLALGGNFSMEADSHLVCIQHEEGVYQTQAINIKDRPRIVTGASFVVFNCALKTSSGLTAKSSIVEDGIMVQVLADTMQALRQSLRDMKDMDIVCGPVGAETPDEIVTIQWVDDDRRINVGVRSPMDGTAMDGVASVRIHSGTDYMSERHMIRWTEVFLVQTDEMTNNRRSEPLDISKTSDLLAQSCCIALTPRLADLQKAGRTKIGLRVTLGAENVGYEIGSNGEQLPTEYMNDLDSELVPSMHRLASVTPEGTLVLELIFHILEH